MRHPVLRGLMVVVGLLTVAVYLAGAWLAYQFARFLWRFRPPWELFALYLLVFTLVAAYVSYHVGTARILRQLRAGPLPRERAPSLYRRVDEYADRMGVETPALLVGDVGQPNALALGGGRSGGAIVVDRRLFELLTFDELSAILAHELGHIERRDTLVQTLGFSVLQTLSGVLSLLFLPVFVVVGGLARGVAWIEGRPSEWTTTLPGRLWRAIGSVVTLGLFALTLALFAHSRRRELAADERAAEVTGQPLALARALRKIERATEPPWGMLSPLYTSGDEEGLLTRLLSTHPDTERRVERLRELADEAAPRRIPVE